MSKKQHQERMNRVVQYIESNLDNELNIQALSNISYYSEFHFHRLFRSYVGVSIYAYRKRLLLERAVTELMHSNESITDIAFNAGYSNQSSFNKAFKIQYACSPRALRQKRVITQLQTLPFNKGENIVMKATIRQVEPINVICAREVGSYKDAAPIAWGRIMKYGYSNRHMKKEVRSIGISHDDPNITAANQIRYDACLDIDGQINPDDNLFKHTISGGKYAVFLHEGAYDGLQQSYDYIFNHWLPENHAEIRPNDPCFEIYLNRDPRKTKPENLKTEIHIPLS